MRDRYDYEAIAAELLRALRGHRSQTAFSRRLGYRCNVAYTWESQRRFPTAAVALYGATRVGLDVAYAVETFYRGRPDWLDAVAPDTPAGVATLLRDLRGATPIVDLCERAGRSRFAVARWLKGDAEPRLPDFLRMVEATSLRLLDWLAALVDPAELPSIAQPWAELDAARTLTHTAPWAPAVLLALQLDAYAELDAHRDAWIAERIGIDAASVGRCLDLLATTGQIRRHRGRWRVVRVQTVDTRRAGGGTALKEFWSEVGLERLRTGSDGLFSFNLFTISRADLARLEQLQRAHFRAMRQIIAASEPGEEVVLANLQLVRLGGTSG